MAQSKEATRAFYTATLDNTFSPVMTLAKSMSIVCKDESRKYEAQGTKWSTFAPISMVAGFFSSAVMANTPMNEITTPLRVGTALCFVGWLGAMGFAGTQKEKADELNSLSNKWSSLGRSAYYNANAYIRDYAPCKMRYEDAGCLLKEVREKREELEVDTELLGFKVLQQDKSLAVLPDELASYLLSEKAAVALFDNAPASN